MLLSTSIFTEVPSPVVTCELTSAFILDELKRQLIAAQKDAKQAHSAARKLEQDRARDVAVLEECLAVAKQAEAKLLRQTSDQTRIHQDAIDRLITEHQKAEMDRIAALEAEKKAKEDAAFEAEKAAQAAAEAKSANEALDATPNALMKQVGDLLEGMIAKRPCEDENRPP